MNFVLIISIFSLVIGCFAEIVNVDVCEYDTDKFCQLKEVRVTPCKEAATHKPCVVRKGTNVSIDFDYTPLFNTDQVFSMAYSETFVADLPMPGMNKYACNFTTCPVVSGRAETYSNVLHMSTSFPSGSYTVKYWLWDALHMDPNNKYIGCCFIIKIKLRS